MYTATATSILVEESGQEPGVLQYAVQGSTLTLINPDPPGTTITLSRVG